MRKAATLFGLLSLFSMLALAETWQGRLIDSTCYAQQKSAAACDPSSTTTTFALFIANKPYNLDDAGNAKVIDAFKNRADRSSDPTKAPGSQVMAKIVGTKEADNILKVETVELQ